MIVMTIKHISTKLSFLLLRIEYHLRCLKKIWYNCNENIDNNENYDKKKKLNFWMQ